MYNRLYSFLCKFNLIYERQFGFRAKHSTSHALISLIEMLKKYLDNDEFVCGVFIALQKAFDTVDHEILLEKLSHYGIRGVANNWFKSFLSNRNQYVSIAGVKSESKQITCGVPQGSTLGPLLFLLYINNLHNVFSNCIVHHFADDTNLIFSSKKVNSIQTVVNCELKKLAVWLSTNKLSLNESKTEVILFRKSMTYPNQLPSIKLNKHKLTLRKTVSYLGITIDESLSWIKHTDNVCTKLSRANGLLSKLRHYVPLKTCISVYHSIFQSAITYGSLSWCFTNKNNINKLCVLQKKCVRIMTFSAFDEHSEPLLSSLNLLKVSDVFMLQLLKFVHQFINHEIPESISDIFKTHDKVHSINIYTW